MQLASALHMDWIEAQGHRMDDANVHFEYMGLDWAIGEFDIGKWI